MSLDLVDPGPDLVDPGPADIKHQASASKHHNKPRGHYLTTGLTGCRHSLTVADESASELDAWTGAGFVLGF